MAASLIKGSGERNSARYLLVKWSIGNTKYRKYKLVSNSISDQIKIHTIHVWIVFTLVGGGGAVAGWGRKIAICLLVLVLSTDPVMLSGCDRESGRQHYSNDK